jgi:polysaccharide biosynthesis/export protein
MRNLLFWIISCLLFFGSCVSPEKLRKEYVFFNEGLDTSKINQYQLIEPVIQKGDLLQISIVSRSSSSNQIFNNAYSSTLKEQADGPSTGQQVAANGYLVDITTGEIKLPLLGIIAADGMTKIQLEKEIIKRASDYLKEDPIVNIRYLNYSVTFLGNVAYPGKKIFSSERVTFLDALGEAGGIAQQGADLKKVLIIRQQNGKQTSSTIDLTNGNFFKSPYYYLKQNDVVYVPPSNRQLVNSDPSVSRTLQYVNVGFFAVNFIVTLISLIR